MDTPRVIYSIATRLGTPGLGTVSAHAVRALIGEGWLKRAVTYGNKTDLPSGTITALSGNPAKLIPFLPDRHYRPIRKLYLDYRTARIIERAGCSVFHGWNNQAILSIRAAKRLGATAVLECGSTYTPYKDAILDEEYALHGLRREHPPRYAALHSSEEFQLADYILVPSEFARQTFIGAGFDPQRLAVIPRAVNLDKFVPVDDAEDVLFTVLYVGRCSIRKGLHYLLEAWARLGLDGTNLRGARLRIVGGMDDDFKPIAARYAGTPGIEFTGHSKDVAKEFGRASAFVFPSLEEGSAKVNYEAMASGLPVVTTRQSGSPVTDGVDGFIIPIRDPGAIGERIAWLHAKRSEAREMGRRGRCNVMKYTWENYRTTLLGVYRDRILTGKA